VTGRIASEIGTILLALGMAFLVWVAAVREEDPIETRNFLPRIPLRVVDAPPNLVIADRDALPADVQVKIRAPRSVWQTLTLGKIRAWIDLSGYGAGEHTVPVQVEIAESLAVAQEISPPAITVRLEPQATRQIPVTVRLLDSPPPGYFNRPPTTDPISVTVKGSAAAVAQVEQVVAEVRLNSSKETIRPLITLSPRTATGVPVSEVALEPDKSRITVPIEQRFGYKDVSVKANVVGHPAPGYWVSSISVDPTTVTLVGGPSVLGDITGFVETAPVDINGATADVTRRVPLNLPPGASLVVDESQAAENGRSVQVTIGIAALTGGRTVPVGLTVQGVRQDLTWSAAPEVVDVILSGPLPLLQSLKSDDIAVVVDVFGLAPGVHRIQPEVIHPDDPDGSMARSAERLEALGWSR